MGSATPAAMTAQQPPNPPGAAADTPDASAAHPHDFDVQKELHRQIRNDPDYDDWEYGTEPLPHEAWVAQKSTPDSEPPTAV
jgi:hypothetical protein